MEAVSEFCALPCLTTMLNNNLLMQRASCRPTRLYSYADARHAHKILAYTSIRVTSIHSFIHIEHLYSAPSRRLLKCAPKTSTVKQSSLKVRKNAGETILLNMRSSEARPFQVEGPTTEKARICLLEVRAKGTRRRPRWEKRSDRELKALEGQQNSHR